ncbi:hypothetical protein D3C74_189970 [compost metagenome]
MFEGTGRVIAKSKDIARAFVEGFVSGFVANIITILINTFASTARNMVRMLNYGIHTSETYKPKVFCQTGRVRKALLRNLLGFSF